MTGAIERHSDAVARLSQQVAAATRLSVMEGILDFSGHISARLPGADDLFLIQRAPDSRADLDPDRLLVVDLDGNVVEGEGKPPLEVLLHIGVLRARPDVNAVLHSHLEQAIALTLMKGVTLQLLRPASTRWASGVPTHPFPGSINTPEKAEALVGTLAAHHAALMRAHGIVLVAESVPALFVDSVFFCENARTNLLVLNAGQECLPLTEEELGVIEFPRAFNIPKLWSYYMALAKAAGVVPEGWSGEV